MSCSSPPSLTSLSLTKHNSYLPMEPDEIQQPSSFLCFQCTHYRLQTTEEEGGEKTRGRGGVWAKGTTLTASIFK